MASHPESPLLPPELEREIFETAAIRHPKVIPNLFLVSRRVYDWVGCVKYRTILPAARWHRGLVDTQKLCSDVELLMAIKSKSRPHSFFCDRVKHLFAENITDLQLQTLLSVCKNINILAVLTIRAVLPSPETQPMFQLQDLRPRRLSIEIEDLILSLPKDAHFHPILTSVTHLDLYDTKHRDDFVDHLALLHPLTHLSLWNGSASGAEMSAALSRCRRLESLVDMHGGTPNEAHPTFPDDASCTADMRFVSIVLDADAYLRDWVVGTQGGLDFWARADEFIVKRRHGDIEPSTRYWIEESDGI
ncbi:hypothetical protein R3P38DRAFT_2635516 [Favolaschia claudopus]|uniref:F-box domain-containing protein n=1 Tax=Favolaschia claudopus TaxID=2862362 RepID=A0AAW0AV04_9AGAR